MEQSRRSLLRMFASLPLLAADSGFAAAGNGATVDKLIGQASAFPHVSDRIDFIARALIGKPYQGNTLIGGPGKQEKFVIRDDAFDCVTYCEIVLAAAISRDYGGFEDSLRRIRYDQGDVQWRQRNHYFADWNQRNIHNRVCEAVAVTPSVVIRKNVTWHRELGPHPVVITGIAPATLISNKLLLKPGDIIGFTSRRANLDFFHTGLIAFGRDGRLLLRHASQRGRRVMDEDMAAFLKTNNVQYVTLVRAREPAA